MVAFDRFSQNRMNASAALRCVCPGRFVILSVLLIAPAFEAGAQSHRSPGASAATLKVDVSLVTLDFSVKEASRRYVAHLTKADIQIYEDGVLQQITHFGPNPTPIKLMVLLDVSQSILHHSEEIFQVTEDIRTLLRHGDEAAVITFADFPSVDQEFTPVHRQVFFALERGRRYAGATNINDAIYLAARKLASVPGGRQVILLLSDGKGNRGERERASRALRRSQASLIWVSFGFAARLARGVAKLNQWIQNTGGHLLSFSAQPDFKSQLSLALNQIRSQYSLGYISSNKAKDGGFRKWSIRIAPHSPLSSKPKVVESPAGYFAPSEETEATGFGKRNLPGS